MKSILAGAGVLASLTFLGGDVVGVALWKGYRVLYQSINELTAVGAPTRSVVVPLFILSHLLLVGFGIGIWTALGDNAASKVLAALVIGNGLCSLASDLFPMTLGRAARLSDPGVALGAVAVVLMVAALLTGVVAFDNWLRWLSLAIVAAFAVLTVLGLTLQSSPHVGLQERVMGYAWLAWVAVLSVTLLRSGAAAGATPSLPT